MSFEEECRWRDNNVAIFHAETIAATKYVKVIDSTSFIPPHDPEIIRQRKYLGLKHRPSWEFYK